MVKGEVGQNKSEKRQERSQQVRESTSIEKSEVRRHGVEGMDWPRETLFYGA